MVFEVFGHYQHLQPVGHSAALIGSLQQGQNKNVTSQDGSKQSTLSAANQVNLQLVDLILNLLRFKVSK